MTNLCLLYLQYSPTWRIIRLHIILINVTLPWIIDFIAITFIDWLTCSNHLSLRHSSIDYSKFMTIMLILISTVYFFYIELSFLLLSRVHLAHSLSLDICSPSIIESSVFSISLLMYWLVFFSLRLGTRFTIEQVWI